VPNAVGAFALVAGVPLRVQAEIDIGGIRAVVAALVAEILRVGVVVQLPLQEVSVRRSTGIWV